MAKTITGSNQLITILEEQFKKAPQLPGSWRETIVSITPWIALIFGILGVLTSLGALGMSSVVSPLLVMGGGVKGASGYFISILLSLVSSALLLASYPGTKKRLYKGWTFLFWSEIVSIVASLLGGVGGIISAIIFGGIALYILFQIKSYYK